MKTNVVSSFERRPISYDALILPFATEKVGESQDMTPYPLFDIGQLQEGSSLHLQYELLTHAQAFSGKEEEVVLQYIKSPHEKRVVFVGIGTLEGGKDVSEAMRSSFSKAITLLLKERGVHKVSIALPDVSEKIFPRVARAVLEGCWFGAYRFQRYMTEQLPSFLQEICYVTSMPELFEREQSFSKSLFEGLEIVRSIVNSSACDTTPAAIAECAQKLEKIPGMSVTVHGPEWIAQQKMGLLEAVGSGAVHSPRFVIIEWKGAEGDPTVFIGKGITYDTGGLNIKPTGSMETMRADMAGAGSLIGLMHAIGSLRLPIAVTVLLPLAENAVDAASMRPGDVYTSRKGMTVEIANTDAEGRLILADAFDYAVTELRPQRMIDVATLTGASEVALGSDIFALFSNSDPVAHQIEAASRLSGEPLWRFPLYKKYTSLLKSDFADIKNVAGVRTGGAINAALFLEEFVKDVPWAHLDIAGPSYFKDGRGMYGKGASSIPMRTLLEYCYSLAGIQRE